jgi:plastocyanin domain-containing protein
MSAKQIVDVTVAGGYSPAVVHLQQGQPAALRFTRTSDQGCLDQVHSADLHFASDLPLNVAQTFDVPTDKAGEFNYSCGMDMFSGTVVVD